MIVTIPCSCFFICRTGNCYTSWPATPRIINLIAESEVRTGHSKRNESIFRGICIRFCDSLMGPVGTTKSPDPSGLVIFVQDFYHWPRINHWIVSVHQINIYVIRSQAFKRLLNIVFQIFRCYAVSPIVRMTSFGNDHNFFSVSSVFEPMSQRSLTQSIIFSCIKSRNSLRINLIQQFICIFSLNHHRYCAAKNDLR